MLPGDSAHDSRKKHLACKSRPFSGIVIIVQLLCNVRSYFYVTNGIYDEFNQMSDHNLIFLCSITITAYKYFYSTCIRYSIPVENVVCVLAEAGDKEDGWIMQIYMNAMSNKKSIFNDDNVELQYTQC